MEGDAHVDRRLLRSLLPPLALAFVAIGTSYRLGLVPIRSYGVTFVAVFAWIGLRFPPRTSLRALPLFLPAYVVPLVGAHPGLDPRALVFAGAMSVFVAEKIAGGQRRTLEAQEAAQRSARAFRIVAEASASLQQLEPDAVLEAVVDSVMSLGYDGANLVVIDDDALAFALIHPRGLSLELGRDWHPLGSGMTAEVRRTNEPLVVEDYQAWEHSIDYYRHCGVRTLIGVPMVAGTRLVGVLVASTRSPRPVTESDVGALQALSLVAGAAMLNVERYQHERVIAEEQAQAALTDGLTGLPNRRHADQIIRRVKTGTSLVMIDVDNFRQVNERLGHAGGDRVLQAIASHLAGALRDDDFVARFGGEELLLVLPGRNLDTAHAVVERLLESWRASGPETTFSAGIAEHRCGDVAATLARADEALYEAKRSGRDRCLTEVLVSV